VIDIALFVTKSSLAGRIEERILPYSRFRQGSLGDREIQFRQIPTIEVPNEIPNEIGRTKLEGIANLQH
jgi:hypothetical protein